MTVAVRHQDALSHFTLRDRVREALDSDLGRDLAAFADAPVELVGSVAAEVVLLECGAPGSDIDVWERSCRSRVERGDAAEPLVLLYSGAEGWQNAGEEERAAARRLSPHPIRFLDGSSRDRGVIDADLLGALLTLHPHLRDNLLQAIESRATVLLEWPRTLEDGTFIDRPEVEKLERDINSSTPTTRFLIGPPGSGKSALLAEVGMRARARGLVTVGIKADALTADIHDDETLGRACGVPFALSTVVGALRMRGPVVVLVDQLDAVSALLDVHTSRLDALLGFIGRVSGLTGVHVAASTRPFERAYDARLRSLHAEEIDLGVLPVEGVRAALRANGLERLVPAAREIETPWALDLVVRHPPPPGASLSLAGALRHYWEAVVEKDDNPERAQVVRELAATISNEEVFWVDEAAILVQSDADQLTLDVLVQDGVLTRFMGRPSSVGFRHQTLYAYALARTLATDGVSLSEHVLDAKREGLFVRQTLLAGLEELRETDSSAYQRELGRLLDGVTRTHLRALLVRWMGSREEPSGWERDQIVSLLATEDGDRMLAALTASPDAVRWLVHEAAFLRWVANEPETAEHALPLLRTAAHEHADVVKALVQEHWHAPEFDRLTDGIVSSFARYDTNDIGIIEGLVRRGTAYRSVFRLVDKARPEDVFRVVGVYVDQKIAEAEKAAEAARAAEPGPVRSAWLRLREEASVRWEQALSWLKERKIPSVEEVRLGRIRFDLIAAGSLKPSYEDVFSRLDDDWRAREVRELVSAHPAAFLQELWPRALHAMDRLPERRGVERVEYEDRLMISRRDRQEPDRLVDLLFEAIGALAENSPDAFLAFAREHESNASHLPHALIAHGFSRGGQAVASEAADYLTGDPRRLTLGDREDSLRYTKEAMQTVFEYGDPGEQYAVESALVEFRMYPRPVPGINPEDRRDRLHAELRHRLRLLRAVPPNNRSARVQRLIQEGERRFPNVPEWDMRVSSFYGVGARVGHGAMAGMSDDDLLALFDEYDDTTDWDQPTRRVGPDSGGVVEQSRAFRAFAVEDPERVEGLLTRLTPERHEAYAAQALDGLVEARMEATKAVYWAIELDRKGFRSGEFRDRVASALETAAERSGLPDNGIDLLRRWLGECESPAPGELPGGDKLPVRPSLNPVSFGIGGFGGIVPHGRGYMMGALLKGLLNRSPPDYTAALDLLESRLRSPNGSPTEGKDSVETNVAVWGHTLTHSVQTLNGDRARATAVFDQVFAAFPDVWRLPFTPRIVAIGMGAFSPDETVAGWLDGLARSPHPYLRQVYGELLMLARANRNCPPWTGDVRTLADTGDLTALRGLSLTSAEAWQAAHVQSDAAHVLATSVRRAPRPEPRAAGSASQVPNLWDGVNHLLRGESRFAPLTDEAIPILDALTDRPDVAVRLVEHLAPHIERLVGTVSEVGDRRRAARIATGLAGEAMNIASQDASVWSIRRGLGKLTSVALTLHRAEDENLRETGLSLFELLLKMDPHAALGAQRVIDDGVGAGDEWVRNTHTSRPPREF